MKVVLDANIYVSSLISTLGNPKQIINFWRNGAFEILISQPILEEVGRVLRYSRIVKRHKQGEEDIQRFLELLSTEAVWVEPKVTLAVIEDDETDNRYLECAAEGKGHYIISGDEHLLALGEYQGIIILSPAAFAAMLRMTLI
jgi:putative PIN family toxin of toxin-antitoxin system